MRSGLNLMKNKTINYFEHRDICVFTTTYLYVKYKYNKNKKEN